MNEKEVKKEEKARKKKKIKARNNTLPHYTLGFSFGTILFLLY